MSEVVDSSAVEIPEAVDKYNRNMGGVDRFDQLSAALDIVTRGPTAVILEATLRNTVLDQTIVNDDALVTVVVDR